MIDKNHKIEFYTEKNNPLRLTTKNMDKLSLYEIIYITRFLNLKNTFSFIKSLKLDLNKSMLVKNKKLMVIENLYNSYFEKKGNSNLTNNELKELLEFFHNDIDVEDLICFMANVYPNSPYLCDTILFDLLKLYNFSMVDWSLVRAHFKFGKKKGFTKITSNYGVRYHKEK